MRNYVLITTFWFHDLNAAALKGQEDIFHCYRFQLIEGIDNCLNEFLVRVRSFLMLERLYQPEKQRSSTLRSGLFGGWKIKRIFKSSLLPWAITSGSSGLKWGLAFSCWTYTTESLLWFCWLLGHETQIAV